MIVYWAMCLMSLLASGLCVRNSLTKQRPWLAALVSALPMILVAALRYDVGQDYLYTYVPYFENVSQVGAEGYIHMELLYHLLNVLVASLNGSYVWVFAITALIFFWLLYEQIYEDSPDPLLSVFLIVGMGYCFVFFNAMRQMVGCAILLYSVRYINKRKLLPFMICVALATGFHTSCALFVVMYWASRIRIRPRMAAFIVLALVVMSEGLSLLARQLISLTQYAVYLLSVFDTGETAYVTLAINAVLLIFMSICYQEDAQYQLYYNMQLVALAVTIFSGKIVLILRCMWMFGLPSIISLPMAKSNMQGNERDRKLATAIIVLLYFAYATWTVGVQNSNSVIPYQSIFGRWLS